MNTLLSLTKYLLSLDLVIIIFVNFAVFGLILTLKLPLQSPLLSFIINLTTATGQGILTLASGTCMLTKIPYSVFMVQVNQYYSLHAVQAQISAATCCYVIPYCTPLFHYQNVKSTFVVSHFRAVNALYRSNTSVMGLRLLCAAVQTYFPLARNNITPA